MKLWLPMLLLTATLARAEDPIVASPLPPVDAPTSAVPAPVPAPAAEWLSKGTALVGALDKVNARSKVLTIKVGQSADYGSLTIMVQACVVRPPDVPADAAAFLVVTDRNPNVPKFSRWMLQSEPSLSMMVDPVYDLWVVGCSA